MDIKQQALDWTRKHRRATALLGVTTALVLAMALTGTLSYPGILFERQVQLIRSCRFGTNAFSTGEYGFSVSAPDGHCFVANRLFPADGSVIVLPRGLYSVISEYAFGKVVQSSRSIMLFEPVARDRNPTAVITALRTGGFLREAAVTEMTNPYGLKIVVAKNVRGVDSTSHFDWAFILRPDGKVFLSVLNIHPQDPVVFDRLLETLQPAS